MQAVAKKGKSGTEALQGQPRSWHMKNLWDHQEMIPVEGHSQQPGVEMAHERNPNTEDSKHAYKG